MRIISCAGYYRTGSSAVSDFFSEFYNCLSLGSYEFRFIQDPNGISDLEYNIVENNHRHNTSHAIKQYLKLIKFLNGTKYSPRYSTFFGDKFMQISEHYINNITELQCKAWWHIDQIEYGGLFYFLDRLYAKAVGFFQKGRSNTSMLVNEPAYFTSISANDFYRYTKDYINELFSCVNKSNADFIMVDQLVPPSNINRYLNYFDDIKVISVERDPRDLYVLEKTKYRWGIMPYKDVKIFCKWYRITRANREIEKDDEHKIMRIYFEDLIYNYEETCSKLIDFVGLRYEDHIHKKTVFVPEKSIKNTKIYLSHPNLSKEVSFIEDYLSEYLYPYPNN